MGTRRAAVQMLGCLAVCVVLDLCPGTALAAAINVPADYASIQAAIDAANDGDEVVVARDTYYECIDFKGKAITVRSTDPGDPAVAAATIIDGEQNGSVVTFANGEGAGSVITGLTITNGNGRRAYEFREGGGIDCRYSSPTIARNTVTGNRASHGGGIYCHGGSPTIEGNVIRGNLADGDEAEGGGIYCLYSSPTINGNTIRGNSARPFAAGGGIYSYAGLPTIQGNAISDNLARFGGGIMCFEGSPTIEGNTISGNSAGYTGGGIQCGSGSPTITGNTIRGNSARHGGGGIYFDYACSPTMQGNTISDNSAGSAGGGIYCSGGSPTIRGNTISDNSAESGGGGIYSSNSGAAVMDSIIAFSDSGGGIWVAGTPQPTVSYCDAYGNAGGDYMGFTPSGPGNISEDPLFADAAGGDFHLKSTGGRWDTASARWVYDAEHSPCIDRGDRTSDYSQEPERNGNRVNIGAYGNTPEASKSRRLHLPELSWLGTTGYEADGVDPDQGAGGDTRFRFKVCYGDADGHAPRYVSLHLRRNGRPFREFAMVRGVGDYTSGRVYRRTRKLPPGKYEHCFKARDRDGLATSEATEWTPGPIVGPRTSVALTSLCVVPTSAGAQITFSLSSAAQVQARILNIAGRSVKTLCRAKACDVGANTLLWNAQSDQGLPVPNGTYLVEVTAKAGDGGQARAVAQVRVNR